MTEGSPLAPNRRVLPAGALAPFVLRSSSQEMVMMKRHWVHRARVCSLTLAGLVLCAGVAAPAHAQVVQVTRSDAKHSVGFNLGYFMVKGVDSRIDDDVLLADLNDLLFDVSDFNNV